VFTHAVFVGERRSGFAIIDGISNSNDLSARKLCIPASFAAVASSLRIFVQLIL
jgi:hypothetical protein